MSDDFRIVPTLYDREGRPYCASINSPVSNTVRAKCILPPNKVIPVIFVPGIMGSNLRGANGVGDDEIIWRPDDLEWVRRAQGLRPAERQRRYNKETTRVDFRAPVDEDLLFDLTGFRSKEINGNWNAEFARRGWGSVMQGSYAGIMCLMEYHLNRIYHNRQLSDYWRGILSAQGGARWGELRGFRRLVEQELLDASEYWYPVHAVGYNWLQSNDLNGRYLARMIDHYMNRYRRLGYQCSKSILVTHSMGGLVARAAVHPSMGNAADKVLGVVHGVQPIVGAPAAYKRVRAGNEAVGITGLIAARLLGWSAAEVTPVFAQSPGPLELLPTKRYPRHWLSITKPNGNAGWRGEQIVVRALPNADPYAEIYRERRAWWRLINEGLINPAGRGDPEITPWNGYLENLKLAEDFHDKLGNYFHGETWLHYGADPRQRAWGRVRWKLDGWISGIENGVSNEQINNPLLVSDDFRGKVRLQVPTSGRKPLIWSHSIASAEADGDATVPHQSGGAVPASVKFVARMRGFEHQESYDNENVQSVTLYSIIKIAGKIS